MPAADLQEQLVKYLTDAHSFEEQALAQLRVAPRAAGDAELAGAKPSKVKDVVMGVGGLGFVLFAKLNPDTPA